MDRLGLSLSPSASWLCSASRASPQPQLPVCKWGSQSVDLIGCLLTVFHEVLSASVNIILILYTCVMPGVPSLPWVPRGWGWGRGPGVEDGLPLPGWLQQGAVWAGEPACWPGPFPGGPPSWGLWGAQRQARGPLSQPCAGHSEGTGVAGGRHVCRGRAT